MIFLLGLITFIAKIILTISIMIVLANVNKKNNSNNKAFNNEQKSQNSHSQSNGNFIKNNNSNNNSKNPFDKSNNI